MREGLVKQDYEKLAPVIKSVIGTESSSSCFIRAVSYYCLYSDNKVHLDSEVHQL